MLLRLITTLIAFLILTSCVTSEVESTPSIVPLLELAPPDTKLRRAYLVGTWRIDQPRLDGSDIHQTIGLNADGTFVIDFLIEYADGWTWEQREIGYWGVSGDIYFTIIRESSGDPRRGSRSPEDPSNYLAYRVLDLSDSRFRYQTIVTGNVFEATKVSHPSKTRKPRVSTTEFDGDRKGRVNLK